MTLSLHFNFQPLPEWVSQPLLAYDRALARTPASKLTLLCIVMLIMVQKIYGMWTTGLDDTVGEARAWVFACVRKYLGGSLGIDKAMKEAKTQFAKDFSQRQASIKRVTRTLPTTSNSHSDVLDLCKEIAGINCDYSKGQYSGCVYHGDPQYTEFINKAMALHQWTNPLHAAQFSGVRKMEAEVVSMVVNMFNGSEECCGAMTSGGTESILLSMKAYRELARIEKGVTKPELIAPTTAHAAFDKAAHYFGIKIKHAKIDPATCKVDMKHMRSLITSNTICLVGSAPQFPHGIIDPIQEIAAIGKAKNIPVHVDACLGGFILAFAEKAGFEVGEKFDFRVPGVTSISCDTHKYGFAPKGSSTILYKTPEIRKHQMHSAPNWPGGIYASPTISGSRVGNVVAGTWAAMMSHGLEGYVQSTKEIISATRYVTQECKETQGLQVMGDPIASVVAVKSDEFDIYRLVTHLAEKGWEMNSLQFPPSMHICCTRLHAINDMENSKRLIADIREGCAYLMKTKHDKAQGMAALYGTTQTIPDRSIVTEVALSYFEAYYDIRR